MHITDDMSNLKAKLKELAAAVNSFKSEAVQVRVVELLFEGDAKTTAQPAPRKTKATATKTRRTRKVAKKTTRRGRKPAAVNGAATAKTAKTAKAGKTAKTAKAGKAATKAKTTAKSRTAAKGRAKATTARKVGRPAAAMKPGRPAKAATAARRGRTKKAAAAPKPKPSAKVVAKLFAEGYFNTPRTVADVIRQASSKHGVKLKGNQVSPSLLRMHRDGKLKRDKNNAGDYSYAG